MCLQQREENINQWVDDIWHGYDNDDDGNIDKREVKKFIDESFERVGLKHKEQCPYTEFDLDDFFDFIDVTGVGCVSRAEFRNYLRKYSSRIAYEKEHHHATDHKHEEEDVLRDSERGLNKVKCSLKIYPDEELRSALGLTYKYIKPTMNESHVHINSS